MGLLDDAIREHLELKRRHGASDDEVTRLQDEVFGADAPVTAREPHAAEELPEPPPAEPAQEPAQDAELDADPLPPVEGEPAAVEGEPAPAPPAPEPPAPVLDVPAPPAPPAFTDAEPWLEEPDEVPAEESLERGDSEYVTPDEGPEEGEDVLEETPEFLQETPEHDRLWFEQKPPRDFDFGN